MNSIVLVEDHTIVRESLHQMLELQEEFKVIDETGDGQEAVELASTLEPDILVVDLTIPGLHGLDVIRQVNYQVPHTRIIVLSIHNRNPYVISAMGNGADGYVLKDDPYRCILEAMDAVLNDRRYLSPSIEITKEKLLKQIGAGSHASSTPQVLTPREKEVLLLIGAGNTTAQIAEKLSISPRTVEVHSRNIRNKLDLENTNQMIRWAIERGLIPADDS